MNLSILLSCIFLLLLSCTSEKAPETTPPEKQISFALENRPHAYYVEQAGIWWKKIEQD
ncbi:MAG: hypothetical protein AAGI38_24575 [Bacteroidota bacterium]